LSWKFLSSQQVTKPDKSYSDIKKLPQKVAAFFIVAYLTLIIKFTYIIMRLIILRSLPILLLSLFIACNSDEEEEEVDRTPTDGLFYGDTELNITSSFRIEYGSDGAFTNHDFFLTDGDFSDIEAGELSGTSFLVYAELFSEGTTFREGMYNYSTSRTAGENYFTNVSYSEVVNGEPGDEILANGGTVIITGTPEDYTIIFDVSLTNGETIRGTYSGAFPILDQDGDVDQPTTPIDVDVASLNVTSRNIEDFGPGSTHYNYDFYLSDFDGTDGTFEIYLELFSEGTDQFNTGTFTYGANTGNYFNVAYYGFVDAGSVSLYEFTGGTVTVTRNGDEFTITFDANMQAESTITGSDTGVYTIQ
jgi:hypothetical protein